MNFIFSPWRAHLGWYLQKIKKEDEQKEAQASIKMRCHLMHKTWEIRKFWVEQMAPNGPFTKCSYIAFIFEGWNWFLMSLCIFLFLLTTLICKYLILMWRDQQGGTSQKCVFEQRASLLCEIKPHSKHLMKKYSRGSTHQVETTMEMKTAFLLSRCLSVFKLLWWVKINISS